MLFYVAVHTDIKLEKLLHFNLILLLASESYENPHAAVALSPL